MGRKRKHAESDDETLASSGDEEESDRSECSGTGYDTESDTEYEIDPWATLIGEAEQRNLTEYNDVLQDLTSSGLDIGDAEVKARSIMLPKIQKELENIYLERLEWMRDLRKNPVHKKIMYTRDKFLDYDGVDPDEALAASN